METKHSRLGIAAFVLSIAVGVLMFALFIIAGLLHAHHREPGGYQGQLLVGMVTILLLAIDVVAVGLGIAAICQTDTKRVFGILGLSFSTLTLLGTGALIVVGLTFARGH